MLLFTYYSSSLIKPLCGPSLNSTPLYLCLLRSILFSQSANLNPFHHGGPKLSQLFCFGPVLMVPQSKPSAIRWAFSARDLLSLPAVVWQMPRECIPTYFGPKVTAFYDLLFESMIEDDKMKGCLVLKQEHCCTEQKGDQPKDMKYRLRLNVGKQENKNTFTQTYSD